METIISTLLILFCLLGMFDGLYFHLMKYQLYRFPSARREHRIHTARAFVFFPLAILIFVLNSGGLLLYSALSLVAIDLCLEFLDILEEREARKPLGGISSEETAIHVFASSFKFGAIVLVLVSKSAAAYSLKSPLLLSHFEFNLMTTVGIIFAGGSLLGGVLSILLEERKHLISKGIANTLCDN